MKSRPILSIFLLILLFACSKDDNPGPPEVPDVTSQGVFIDSPVTGLKYETETHNGVTDENGKFEYEEGETVTFFVGDIKLGSARAADELSPISIASTSNATLQTLEVQNIAAFLQTLDVDGDSENGIVISPQVVSAINITEIDFTIPIIQTLGEISISVFQETGINLKVIFPEIATMHLAESLGLDYEPQNLYNLNFVTIFSNYFGPNRKITHWLHEFNDNGKLSKSILYEKYPFRILNEFVFSNYQNGKVDFENTSYSYEKVLAPDKREHKAYYDENFIIEKFENMSTGYNPTPYSVLKELNSENFVGIIEQLDPEGILVLSKDFEYNSDNMIIKVINNDSANNLLSEKNITYNEFGDLKTENTVRPDETYFLFNYFYRGDNTLESLKWEVKASNSETSVLQEFDENETLLKDTTNQILVNGNTQKTIEYYQNGILISLEWYVDRVIKQISYFQPDGNGDSFLYKIEEYSFDGVLDKIKIYNAEGEIIEVYCYDHGVEIDCN